jgi:hypothetical protein
MDQNQVQQFSALFAGMGVVIMLFVLAAAVFMIFLFWRIFAKAGMPGPLALILLLGPPGMLITVCILAFAEWKVVPAPALTYVPPAYPPAPSVQG